MRVTINCAEMYNMNYTVTRKYVEALRPYVSQGSAPTDLRRGGSFNLSFLADPF